MQASTAGQAVRRAWRYVAQLLLAAVVVAIVAFGVLGLELKSDLGQQCGWCNDVACLDVSWWECDSSGIAVAGTPNCGVTSYPNGTATVNCPQVMLPGRIACTQP